MFNWLHSASVQQLFNHISRGLWALLNCLLFPQGIEKNHRAELKKLFLLLKSQRKAFRLKLKWKIILQDVHQNRDRVMRWFLEWYFLCVDDCDFKQWQWEADGHNGTRRRSGGRLRWRRQQSTWNQSRSEISVQMVSIVFLTLWMEIEIRLCCLYFVFSFFLRTNHHLYNFGTGTSFGLFPFFGVYWCNLDVFCWNGLTSHQKRVWQPICRSQPSH